MKKIPDFEKMVEDQTVLCEIQGITEELFTYSEKEREKLLVKIIDKIVCIISNAENDIFSFYDDIEEIISWYKDANGIFAGKEKKKVGGGSELGEILNYCSNLIGFVDSSR